MNDTDHTDTEANECREIAISIARRWPGHQDVNWSTTTTKNILLLIRDALAVKDLQE